MHDGFCEWWLSGELKGAEDTKGKKKKKKLFLDWACASALQKDGGLYLQELMQGEDDLPSRPPLWIAGG